MSDAFVGEVRVAGFGFPPKGWALCNGQLLPINQNQALFSLLGTMYGGDGRTTFALPDFRGRVPMHAGNGYVQGQSAGEVAHTLTLAELPTHSHTLNASGGAATTVVPTGNLLAAPTAPLYGTGTTVALAPEAVGNTGGSQSHENMPPYLTLNFIIALQGVFPSRN